ncbi:MAG: hypothetical protein WBP45_01790 [Daejeonella sp.]
MRKISIFLLSICLVSCGNYYLVKRDWKIFENKLVTKIGYKQERLEKISFEHLDTIKLRSKISIDMFSYSQRGLPLVFRDKVKDSLYIFNRVNSNVYILILTDLNFEKITIVNNSGEDY